MIIAVNTRLLIPGKIEGIGRFTLETLKIITQQHPEHRFIFIFDRKYSKEYLFASNITPVTSFPPARHPLLWYGFFEYGIPAVLRKYKADLFFSPDGWLSLRTPVKSLPVIHDLNFYHYPEFIPYHVRTYYYYFFPRFIRKAHRIITVSDYTKNDIAQRFHYATSKIDVVYNGANTGFRPVVNSVQQTVRDDYTGGCPFFLSVGLIHPRKNLTNLINAYSLFRQEINDTIKLVIVGSRKWWTTDMQQAYEKCGYKDDIIFAGHLPDDELMRIMASALAMVYVSHFEGFGIPVLEAMYSDTPVICSETSSLPEVGGKAVVYAAPSNPESVKSAMVKLYKDTALRNNLIAQARIQRKRFTWEKTAGLVWNSIEKSL